jgi:hypothetical protein|tara:strand:+ start:750 stop:1040 length:291 start_codon:yes stop_codon:yes gene_type:complete
MITVTNIKDPSIKPKIKIDRSSPWGNPFIIGRDGNRREVIAKYEEWIVERPQLIKLLSDLMEHEDVHRLACWCVPLQCHGHVLKRLVEEYREKKYA